MTTRNGLSFITTGDGARIACRLDDTAGKPVLLLSNSIGTDLHIWGVTVPCLAEHFHVLRYDTRGHSASDAPAGTYSIDWLGRDVMELFDALGIRRMHMLGLSLGGIVAQWLAIHMPGRIDRLVFSNTAAHVGPPEYFDQAIAEFLQAPDMQTTAETFLCNWFSVHMLEARDAAVEPFRRTLLTTPREGIIGGWAAVRDADLRHTIMLITHPTLVIADQHDIVTSARHDEEIAAAIPDAQLRLLDTVHLANAKLPDAFLEAVLDFLGVHETV